jgi:hypothetical protein
VARPSPDQAWLREAARRGEQGWARLGQVQVAGADPFFTGMQNELVRRARQFLDARLQQ